MQNIFNYIKSNIVSILLVAIVLITGYYVVRLIFAVHDSSVSPATIIIHDTTTITRYESELKRDTVIKWYEKIIRVEREPEKIYIQKIDSVFLEKIKYFDVMLKVDKKGNTLKIFAVNEKDSTLKEYYFNGIYNNFTATSATGKIFVKTNKFEWSGINLQLECNAPLSFLRKQKSSDFWQPDLFRYYVSLSTGITYKNTLTLNALAHYDPIIKQPFIGLQLNYKIIK